MNVLKFIASVGLCFLVAFLGSAVTTPSIPAWYSQLTKPFFSPPNWIFAPVWTTLYLLMGISLYLVWDKGLKSKNAKKGVKVFMLQLFLNLLWSIVFFGLHSPLLALVVIIALWISIFMTIRYFSKISRMSAYLLVPYVLWVSFALILNYSVWILNR